MDRINIDTTLKQYLIPLMIEKYGKDDEYWLGVACNSIKECFDTWK